MKKTKLIQEPVTKETQNKQVLKWLQSGQSLTAKTAADYWNIYRLSARIYDLKRMGYAIERKLKFNGSCHWCEYFIKTQ